MDTITDPFSVDLEDLADPPAPEAPAAGPDDGPIAAAPETRPLPPPDDAKKAPHGWTWDRRTMAWRPKRPAGRPPRVRASRAKPKTDTAKPTTPTKAIKTPVDHRGALAEITEALYTVLGGTPIPDRVLGYDVRNIRTKLRLQASVIAQNQAGLVTAGNTLAGHNETADRWLTKYSEGKSGAWLLPTLFALAPFVLQTASVWSAPVTPEMEKAADQVQGEIHDAFRTIGQQMMGETPPPAAE